MKTQLKPQTKNPSLTGALNVTLAMTLALAPIASNTGNHAQTGLGLGLQSALAQANNRATPNSKVAVLLILAAREENAGKALELLKQAREELKREQLSGDQAGRILAAIDALEAKIRRRLPPPAPSQETSPSGTGPLLTGTLPTIANLGTEIGASPSNTHNSAAEALPEKEIEKVLSDNPEVREALWEISQGRLARDTSNLDGIIRERTGMTPLEHDEAEAMILAMGNQPGPFLQLLDRLNMMNLDVSGANLRLKQEFDGVSIDTLAEKLIQDATKYSIPVGVLQGVLTDVGMTGRMLGLSSEVLMTFVINANLALRLSDLYGIEMNNSEKEIVLLIVFSAAKVAGQYGIANKATTGMLSGFGKRLGELKYVGKPGEFVNFVKAMLRQPAIAKAAGPVAAEVLAAVDADKDAKPAPTENKADTKADPKATKDGLIKKMASRINFVSLLKGTVHGARSAVETYTLGQAAKYIFKAAHESKRAIHNDNFRRFLMTPSGEGFLKLMVLSMHDGQILAPKSQNKSEQAEISRKTQFIANLARSAKACSDADLATLKADPQTAKLAKYSCGQNPNTARFERLRKEMLTFDEIPNDYVSDLRIAPREHRFRMAELLLQMQFLDGDRSPGEVQFFRTTVAKTLGLAEVDDLEYFNRVHSFIIERGGLEPSEFVPAGFRIRPGSQTSPYDMGEGYTPADAPLRPYDLKPDKPKAVTPAGASASGSSN